MLRFIPSLMLAKRLREPLCCHSSEKRHEYSEIFHPARVTDMDSYIEQTLGGTIRLLAIITRAAVAVGLIVAVLITALFLQMMISKDSSHIAVLRGIGFSLRDIRIQYLSKILSVLVLGIVLGSLFSNTLGQRLLSLFWSLMGASQISFVICPLRTYLLLPLLLAGLVSITTLFSIHDIKDYTIQEVCV